MGNLSVYFNHPAATGRYGDIVKEFSAINYPGWLALSFLASEIPLHLLVRGSRLVYVLSCS